MTSLGPQVLVGATMSDASSSVTVQGQVQKDPQGNITGTKYTIGPAGTVSFVFNARPGSQAAYILGYEIIRDVVDGVNMATTPPRRETGMNTYVASGYACARVSGGTQSCDLNLDKDSTMANGAPTGALNINFAGGLAQVAIDKKGSVSRSTDLRFFGISATNQPFSFDVTGINSRAIYSEQ